MYTCTCLDATLHCTICKHIHLVLREAGSDDDDTPSSGAIQGSTEVGEPETNEMETKIIAA